MQTAVGKYENAQEIEKIEIEKITNEINLFEKNEKIFAEDIAFTPIDVTWKAKDGTNITNVKQALDYLFDN